MRINKYIAHAGVASRRKAEELIKQGLVTVNGQVVRELATIIKTGDQVEVEGTPIYNEEKVYYLPFMKALPRTSESSRRMAG